MTNVMTKLVSDCCGAEIYREPKEYYQVPSEFADNSIKKLTFMKWWNHCSKCHAPCQLVHKKEKKMNTVMTKEDIDNIVCTIMIHDGPDGHIDGHEIITDFIVSLLENKEDQWVKRYKPTLRRNKIGDK